MGNNILDQYVLEGPSDQAILDIFKGEWSSALPAHTNLQTQPGSAGLFEDVRIAWAEQVFGGFVNQDVLELGPLEGGHSYMLQNAGAKSVTGIESNTRAYLKCLCIKQIFNLHKVDFLLGDLNEYLSSSSKHFDVIVGSGVLYHMTEPLKLIERMCNSADKIFLWTHYFDENVIRSNSNLSGFFEDPKSIEVDGQKETCARKNYNSALEWDGFCGGSAPHAIWLSKSAILSAIKSHGFGNIEISFDDANHPNGPSFAICATRL